jgi:hypothetical protein
MALKSIQQAANTWGVSVYTARRLAAAGLVQTVTVGRRRLISENEIARIVATGVSPARAKRRSKTPKQGRDNA